MADRQKQFNDYTRSRLNDLYPKFDDIINKHPSINLYGKTFDLTTLQNAMKNQPFIKTNDKYEGINDNSITKNDVSAITDGLNSIAETNESVVAEFIKINDESNVKFYKSEKIKNEHFTTPYMIITLDGSKLRPNQGVRINTGYAILIKSKVESMTIADNKSVSSKTISQPEFVIIPIISIKDHHHIIPGLYARDREDTGFLTINFTTSNEWTCAPGETVKIEVKFNAYLTYPDKVTDKVKLVKTSDNENGDNELDEPDVFKPKDSQTKSPRQVKNAQIKFYANRYFFHDGCAVFTTFDNSVIPVVESNHITLRISEVITLFTTRKREWCNPKALTLTGLFNPTNKLMMIPAKITNGSEITNNLHCMTHIKSKVELIGNSISNIPIDCRLINGAFFDLENYRKIIKHARHVFTGIQQLSVGACLCKNISESDTSKPKEKLMLIYDYERDIIKNDPELPEKLKKDEKQIFEGRSLHNNAYSTNMYKAFKFLLATFASDEFTPEQCSELLSKQHLSFRHRTLDPGTSINTRDDVNDQLPQNIESDKEDDKETPEIEAKMLRSSKRSVKRRANMEEDPRISKDSKKQDEDDIFVTGVATKLRKIKNERTKI